MGEKIWQPIQPINARNIGYGFDVIVRPSVHGTYACAAARIRFAGSRMPTAHFN